MTTRPQLPPGFEMLAPQAGGPSVPPGFEIVQDEQQPQSEPYTGWGEYARDIGRTALQGMTLSGGDELTAAVRSGLSSELDYDTALEQERQALARFGDQNPWTAFGAQLAGGVALPGVGAAKTIMAAPTMAARALRGGQVGAGYGAVSGYGAGEGGVENRLVSAGEGAVTGAVVGGAIPVGAHYAGKAIRGAQTLAAQAGDHARAAQLYLADRLAANNTSPQQIGSELARGQAATRFAGGVADLPETIADVAPVTQRVLRGVKVGGAADDVIEPFLGNRQAPPVDFARGAEAGGQYSRLNEDLRLAMKLSDESSADKAATQTAKRKANADVAFEAARKGGEPFDTTNTRIAYAMEAQNLAVPQERAALLNAVRMFDDTGLAPNFNVLSQSAAQNKANFGSTNIERFHQAKVGLDSMIADAQGNLKRLLTRLKYDIMDSVFEPDAKGLPTKNLAYRKALDSYANDSVLLNAKELAEGYVRGSEQITPRMWRSMSEPEKNMVRRVYNEAIKGKMGGKAAGPTTDFTGPLRSPNTGDDLRMLLPPAAGKSPEFPGGNREKLTELVRREHRMSTTSTKVLGNSSTAEKAVDAIDVGRLGRTLRYIKDAGGITQAAVGGLQEMLERMSAIKGPRARYLAEKMLSIDPAEQQAFLAEVAATYGNSVAAKLVKATDLWASKITGSAAAATARQSATPDRSQGIRPIMQGGF